MFKTIQNGDAIIFDDLLFRKDKKTGYYLNAKTHKRLHIYVWEYYNGKVPKGHHIHHIDRNKDNNNIENLALLTATEHQKLHGTLFTEERKERMRKNLLENAIPKAKEWHKTEEGKDWHSKHAIETWKNKKPNKYECSYCGKEFETKNTYSENSNKFCSNNCKSAYRRKMGFDNITKICEVCGGEYEANKYQKTKRCKECASAKNRKRG